MCVNNNYIRIIFLREFQIKQNLIIKMTKAKNFTNLFLTIRLINYILFHQNYYIALDLF